MKCCASFVCSCTHYPCLKKTEQKSNQREDQSQIRTREKKFAEILEKQLKEMNERYQEEIQNLTTENSKLKSEITKLQYRSKLDKDHVDELIDKIAVQSKIIEDLQNKIDALELKREIKQKVSEKKVVENIGSDQSGGKKIKELEKIIEELLNKIKVLHTEGKDKDLKYLNRDQEQKTMIKQLSIQNKKLNEDIDGLKNSIQNKERQIAALDLEKRYLVQKIQIISSKPSRKLDQPIIIHKIQHEQPVISQIYVDRPIQKTVFVQTERIVKEFIQPERAVVSRVIDCTDRSKDSKCDELKNQHNQQLQKIQEESSSTYQKYEALVEAYKGERQNLVREIRDRNSEYHLLQKNVGLLHLRQKLNTKPKNSEYDIQVFVHRESESGQQEPPAKEQKKTNIRNQNSTKTNYKGTKRN